MESQHRPPQPREAILTSKGQPQVSSNDPLVSSLPSASNPDPSIMTNGIARTASRRRRDSAVGNGKVQYDSFPQPPVAPEVPKPPPVSYRPTYIDEHYNQPGAGYPAPSFAQRAAVLTGRSAPSDLDNTESDPNASISKAERRSSLNRPIGGVYSEIAQHARDSYSSNPYDPTSPRRGSNPTSPLQAQPQSPPSSKQRIGSAPSRVSKEFEHGALVSDAQHQPQGVAHPRKKEWAPDRSPLQSLEVKLEKRARVEEAEKRLKETKLLRRKEEHPGTTEDEVYLSRSTLPERNSSKIDSINHPGSGNDYISKDLPQTQAHRSPQFDERRGSKKATKRSQEDPEVAFASSTSPPTIQPSKKAFRNPSDVSGLVKRPERGVRFQSEDEIDTSGVDLNYLNVGGSRRPTQKSGMEGSSRSTETRAAQRQKLRQGLPPSTGHSASTDLPGQSPKLYSAKAESSRKGASAATYGGAPDPIPGDMVAGRNQVPKYKIPPQTAAGIQARQMVAFGDEPQHAPDIPAQRRHHLSHVLHHGRSHALKSSPQPATEPWHLDEWRQAGTARLTATDLTADGGPEAQKTAWWERNGSDDRRRSRHPANQDATSGSQNDNGKPKFSPSARVRKPKKIRGLKIESTSVSHARPYVSQYEDSCAESSLISRLKDRASLVALPQGRSRKSDLASVYSYAYSYSCPALADHNPTHPNHICEPYLSKELTESMRSIRVRPVPAVSIFTPPLYLKCGPLLRYTGLKRDMLQTKTATGFSSTERETWRGSVMIVTSDADSNYEPAPVLRLFPEPMELLPPPIDTASPTKSDAIGSEYVDPIAGLPKLSRTGHTVYVKPVDDLEPGVDLSRIEDDDGLFEETRTAAVPTSYGTPDFHPGHGGTQSRKMQRDGPAPKRGHRVQGARLHVERGVTFWRFNLEVELGACESRIAYSINGAPAVGFWVPAKGHTMNVAFHSCNGFSMSVNPADFSGPDPLWRDVLNRHQTRPFHVMIGGGDQIYNDAVMTQSPLFQEWLEIKNPVHKHEADFTSAMREELETFYLERYSMWFSQGLFGMANSQIPMVNIWDDHDIIDGFGSYPHHFMSTPVFCGVGAVAFKYYMLFQHQSVANETSADEPSWLLGAALGPYINELSRSVFVSLGRNVALLGLDCRTERMREEVCSEATYDLVFDRCRREITQGETKHLIVLLGIPIAYPRLVWLENLLTSKVMDPVKALGRTGLLGGFLNKFDGGVEILDDLDDHWTAKNHKQERNWFVQKLQELAAEKSVRVTILGGDVHLAAVGRFYSNPKLQIPKDRDHRYMANVISSAIVNTPPSEMMGDILNKRNKIHHLDGETEEDMIPMFSHDIDGKPRKNQRLLPRRNWCSITEYHPGLSPPLTPTASAPRTPDSDEESPPPPTRLQRSLSLTRADVKPGNLIRRLSGRGPPPSTNGYLQSTEYDTGDSPSPTSPDYSRGDESFSNQASLSRSSTVPANGNAARRYSSAPLPRPGNLLRRATNMSFKAATRDENEDRRAQVDLEQGLDIVINCEVDQKDPAGITKPYRLLVPALHYEGRGDLNIEPHRKKSLVSRLTSLRGRRESRMGDSHSPGIRSLDNSGESDDSEEIDAEGQEAEARPRRWSFGLTQRRQYRDQTPPGQREFQERPRQSQQNSYDETDYLGTFHERPQQQRKYEDRNQQIGQSTHGPHFPMPPKRFESHDGSNDQNRDSIDYHEHLDTARDQQNNGYFGRKPSKVDKLLGVGNARDNSSDVHERERMPSFADRQRSGSTAYEDYQAHRDSPEEYTGIEAYRDRKSWKRWFS